MATAHTKRMTKKQVCALTDIPTGIRTLVLDWTETYGNVDTKTIAVVDLMKGLEDPAAFMVREAIWALCRINEDLIVTTKQLDRTCKGIREKIADGYHVNGLGEFQGAADRADMLCARRQQVIEHLGSLVGAMAWQQRKTADAIVAKLTPEVAS
jgi:hypothetical protein